MSVDFKEFNRKMDKTLEVLQENFGAIRAGRANARVLDRITVEYYGVETPVGQVGSISSPDARTLVIQPWDGSLLKKIEKAIQTSELGINPQNDGVWSSRSSPRSAAAIWSSRSRNTARRARSPSATSAATPWTISKSSRRTPRSPRTTRKRLRRIFRS